MNDRKPTRREFDKADLQELLYEAERNTSVDVQVPWSKLQTAFIDLLDECPDDMTVAELKAVFNKVE